MKSPGIRRRVLGNTRPVGNSLSSALSECNRLTPGGGSARSLRGPSAPTERSDGVAVPLRTAQHPGAGDTGPQSFTPSVPTRRNLTETVVHAFVRDRRRRGRRAATIRCYLDALMHWPERWPETVSDLRLALEHLRTLSSYSRRVYQVEWRVFGRFAERKFGLLNVPAQLTMEPLPRILPRVPIDSDVQRLLDACLDDRERALVRLLLATGIRWGEIPMLRSQIGPGYFDTSEGKSGCRRLPLPEAVAALLSRIGDDEHLWLAQVPRVPRRDGRPMSREGLRALWYRLCARVGVRISPHSTRHKFAVSMLEDGADLRTIQELLGHRSITTTQIYTPLAIDHLARMVDRHCPLKRWDLGRAA